MFQVGITTDNKLVMGGVFSVYDTRGLPLVILVQLMKERNMIISPLHFVEDARIAGWKDKTIISKLSEALSDVYGKSYSDVVVDKLVECNLVGKYVD